MYYNKGQWFLKIEKLLKIWSLCLQTCTNQISNRMKNFYNNMVQNNKKTKTTCILPCLISVIKFLGFTLVVMQIFTHSCIHFPHFLGHVIHLCKMETYFKSLHIVFLVVAYWQALEKACPKHVLWKLSTTPKASQQPIILKQYIVMVFIFDPSSLT